MNTLQKVEGYSGLRKDAYSGGVINVDKTSYMAHQNAKKIALQQMQEKQQLKERVDVMGNEINSIRDELSEIKSLIMQLLNKGQ